MLLRSFVLAFLLSFRLTVADQSISHSLDYYHAIQKAINFLADHKDDLNIDALFGVQIARSQTSKIGQKFNLSSNSLFKSIAESAEKLIKDSIVGIVERDPQYYRRIGALLDHHYWSTIECETRTVGSLTGSDDEEPLSKTNLTETLSDYCLAELFHSSGTCKQREFCKKRIREANYSDYGRAHQLLYLYISLQKHCVSPFEFGQQSRQFCTKMYKQNLQIQRQNFPNLDQDLFMENLLFCGYLGYREFLQNSVWNRSILEWQAESGCYQVEILPMYRNLIKDGDKRRKRREKIVGNRCSLHKTSIAVGAMAVLQSRALLDQICP